MVDLITTDAILPNFDSCFLTIIDENISQVSSEGHGFVLSTI